jgi:hypothetical protein
MMALLTMATMTSCKEENEVNENQNVYHFGFEDGQTVYYGHGNKDSQTESTVVLTERIVTERILTEETIIETTEVENFEPYISEEYKKELEFNSQKNVYFGETSD